MIPDFGVLRLPDLFLRFYDFMTVHFFQVSNRIKLSLLLEKRH